MKIVWDEETGFRIKTVPIMQKLVGLRWNHKRPICIYLTPEEFHDLIRDEAYNYIQNLLVVLRKNGQLRITNAPPETDFKRHSVLGWRLLKHTETEKVYVP